MHFILGVEAGEIACSFFCGSFGVLGKKKGASCVLTDVEKEAKRKGENIARPLAKQNRGGNTRIPE